jgi:bifunctional DNA-binding transcriptional regulator/antitoxin component of YhaV-PrlF toxin-antitoxin module
METMKLKVQERAFPSRGRARLHESLLGKLEIKEGDGLELYKDESAKPLIVTAFGDRHVEDGNIRLSTEDIAELGIAPGAVITVKKRPYMQERIKKTAGETAESVKSGATKAGDSIKGGAAKASESIRGGAKGARETVGKGAESVTKKLKDKDL